jgi:hypothetical protein
MRRLALVGPLLALGCQDYLFAPVCPQTVAESQITGTPADPTPADILFVVDNSGSMADDQRRLAASFDAFINQLSSVPNADYRIAVVTTDLSTPGGEKSGEVQYTYQPSAPYEVTGIENSACTDTGIAHGCFRGSIIGSHQTAFEQDQIFNGNVTVGSCGSGMEEGLAAAVRALDASDTGECNQGFLREGTNLVLIFVSDEQDASPDAITAYADQLSRFKPWSDIRAAAIIGSVGGRSGSCRAVGGLPASECGSQCNECPGASWCSSVDATLFSGGGCGFCSLYASPDCCSAVGGGRYEQFLGEVDARVKAADPTIQTATLIDSICQDDFSNTLRRIAAEIIFDPCYPLSETPLNPDGIAARVAGGRTLVKDVDFEVRQGDPGDPVQVCLTGQLGPGEALEIYYVTDVESRPSQHPACN